MEDLQPIDEWLTKLEGSQITADDREFPVGSFPSERIYPVKGTQRADPNVFFSALIANKLLEWTHLMDERQKIRSTVILKKIEAIFPLYRSRRGRMHYNFWPTNPDIPFPNGNFLHKFDFFRLPDDIDDTALVYGAMQAGSGQVKTLQQDIERHFLDNYPAQPPLYGAWLGDKMPFVVDACAMTNLLNLFNRSRLPASGYSAATESYLRAVILSKNYISRPYEVSPYYPDTAVIIYHLANWLSLAGDRLGELKRHLVGDIKALAEKETHPFRAMLYCSSLLRLNAVPDTGIGFGQVEPFVARYPWFFGSMLSAVKWETLRKLDWKVFHIAHVCEAWNFTLWIEYQLLKATANS